jgi:hypothetical protein
MHAAGRPLRASGGSRPDTIPYAGQADGSGHRPGPPAGAQNGIDSFRVIAFVCELLPNWPV